MNRQVKLWVAVCLVLGLTMAACAIAFGIAVALGRRRLGPLFAPDGGLPSAPAALAARRPALGRGTGSALLYALLLLAPVYFAGLIFSRSFSRATASGPAIGVNILGSVVGGWAEYSTMAVGIRGLALLALAFYLASWLMQRRWEHKPAFSQPAGRPAP